jgi:hypothetical protein
MHTDGPPWRGSSMEVWQAVHSAHARLRCAIFLVRCVDAFMEKNVSTGGNRQTTTTDCKGYGRANDLTRARRSRRGFGH